ncbi:MAG: hypothetical protein ACPIOQ_04405, partial [Promethearchaeia archaeon]
MEQRHGCEAADFFTVAQTVAFAGILRGLPHIECAHGRSSDRIVSRVVRGMVRARRRGEGPAHATAGGGGGLTRRCAVDGKR